MSRAWRIAVAVLAAGALVAGAVAIAQPQPPAQPGQPGAVAGQPGPGPMFMGRMGGGGGPAIAIADGFVFVAEGGTLYKFDINTLELVKQVTYIERPQMMMGGGGFGGGGFGGGGRGGRGGGGGGVAPPPNPGADGGGQ